MFHQKGLEPSSVVDNMNSGREGKVGLILLFSVVYRSQIFRFFLPRNGVDNSNAVINLYSLDSVFKRTHLVFKLKFW